MQLDSFSRFPRNNVVQLPSLVFSRKREILGKHDLPQYVLPILLLQLQLIFICQHLIHSERFHHNEQIEKGNELEKLSSELINLS